MSIAFCEMMPFLVTGQMMLPRFPSPPEMCAVCESQRCRRDKNQARRRGQGGTITYLVPKVSEVL